MNNFLIIIISITLYSIFIIISTDKIYKVILNLLKLIIQYMSLKFKTLKKISFKNTKRENSVLFRMLLNIKVDKQFGNILVEYNYMNMVKSINRINNNIKVPIDYVFLLYINKTITFDNLRYILQDYNGKSVMI